MTGPFAGGTGKLARLPRHQRFRKICRFFAGAERQLAAGIQMREEEAALLRDLAELAAADVSGALREGLMEAADALGQPGSAGSGTFLRAVNTVHRLLLAETGRFPADWDFIDHGGRLDPLARRTFPGMTVYLEDIRSPYNVGSLFRTAESFGAAALYLSPLCADPCHPRSRRTAMGCVEILPWERAALSTLAGPFFALETGGASLKEFAFPRKGTIIAGNEELGIRPETLFLADHSLGRVSISSYGAKGSLNVSVAFGIVMQAWAEVLAGDLSG